MKSRSVIDFHTHVFPDDIAPRALKALSEHSGPYRPCTDGTLKGLLNSMDSAGITLSVVANIATKPTQSKAILGFSRTIVSERIYPLVSFHPENSPDEVYEILKEASSSGIRGVKLHPMYQGFAIDDRAMFPFYEMIEKEGFFIVFHTGYDIAFPGNLQASVDRVRALAEAFKNLSIVTTHAGGWRQWDRVEILTGYDNIFFELSMTVTEVGKEAFRDIILRLPMERLFFGTDSPWTDQAEMIEVIDSLSIPDALKEAILYRNAEAFLKTYRSMPES